MLKYEGEMVLKQVNSGIGGAYYEVGEIIEVVTSVGEVLEGRLVTVEQDYITLDVSKCCQSRVVTLQYRHIEGVAEV